MRGRRVGGRDRVYGVCRVCAVRVWLLGFIGCYRATVFMGFLGLYFLLGLVGFTGPKAFVEFLGLIGPKAFMGLAGAIGIQVFMPLRTKGLWVSLGLEAL